MKHGTVGLMMDLPCNMAVYAPSLSIFLLSQFPPSPSFYLPPPTSSTAQDLVYFLYDQLAVGPLHGIIIFAFVSVILSLIAFFPLYEAMKSLSGHIVVG